MVPERSTPMHTGKPRELSTELARMRRAEAKTPAPSMVMEVPGPDNKTDQPSIDPLAPQYDACTHEQECAGAFHQKAFGCHICDHDHYGVECQGGEQREEDGGIEDNADVRGV